MIEGRIADIRDRERIMRLMSEFKPDIVFHAAALKHVPILERDWSEGVKTNIFGSVNVADAALAAGAEAMVMISTDKAIEPVSMLGLTKRFAEMYCQALDHELATQATGKPRMRLISVRFGNVLASNGSVVPKFKAQIEAGGPVTVTHPDMVRYFMTIREACDLVITAATHALAPARADVSVYVLNMGQPVKIVDLAERMIRLSGLQPGHDIEIVFTGMRPGERLNEILFASEEPTGRDRRSPASWRPSRTSRRCRRCANGSRTLEAGDRQRRSRHHQGHPEGCGAGIRFDRRAMEARSARRRSCCASAGAKTGTAPARRRSAPRRPAGSDLDREPIAAAVDAIASAAEHDIEREHLADHLPHRKAVVGGALIEMRAMRRPERLAPHHPAQQRHRGIGQIIQRQQQRGGEMLMPGQLQQAPAEQQADRQAADVAEKDLRHRPVERRKAEHRAAQRGGDDRRRCRQFAERSRAAAIAARDRHDLGDRHPVEPVHEVDEVDEPEAGQQQQTAFDPERTGRRRSADRRAR